MLVPSNFFFHDLVGTDRYTHAHQFSRGRRELKFRRTRLGGVIRDIRRKIDGNTALEERFSRLLDLALRVRHQEQRQRGAKVSGRFDLSK